MNPLTVVTLLACLAFSAAQLTVGSAGSGGTAPTGGPLDGSGGLGSPLGGTGPLTQTNPANNPANTSPAVNTQSNGLNQVFQNPALSYGLMGGDNLMRAMMAPYLSRFGSLPTLYYLRGGMDKFSSVLMSDMMNRMLSRATGMNPVMSAFMTGQMFDAPDNYAISNMLFNGLNTNSQTNQVNTNSQSRGLLPNGAAQTGSPNSLGNNGINPFLFAPFLF